MSRLLYVVYDSTFCRRDEPLRSFLELWLTDEDVEYLRPVIQPYLDRYYENADWDLNARPFIPAELSSGYVVRIVNERRAAAEGIRPFSG